MSTLHDFSINLIFQIEISFVFLYYSKMTSEKIECYQIGLTNII